MDDVDRIVAGLSRAQRAALSELAGWQGWIAATHLNLGRPSTVGATLNSLTPRGLAKRRSDPDAWGRAEYQILPLGLRVRARLAEVLRDVR